jgi:hypothetical protein
MQRSIFFVLHKEYNVRTSSGKLRLTGFKYKNSRAEAEESLNQIVGVQAKNYYILEVKLNG